MQRDLKAIWLVARREVIDQVRDWRIVVPMLLLVSLFPFVADSTTRQAIGFMNRFGGGLILDNLIPFVVLVIGFFPLAFTLVVALESFVGEKERGTIEPLLSSPLDDRQLYLGKLLVGVTTPLLFSCGSIIIYLILLARRDVAIPEHVHAVPDPDADVCPRGVYGVSCNSDFHPGDDDPGCESAGVLCHRAGGVSFTG